jgi:hypothetical protein
VPFGVEVQVLSSAHLDRLAQLAERCAYIAKVVGSSPTAVTLHYVQGKLITWIYVWVVVRLVYSEQSEEPG